MNTLDVESSATNQPLLEEKAMFLQMKGLRENTTKERTMAKRTTGATGEHAKRSSKLTKNGSAKKDGRKL